MKKKFFLDITAIRILAAALCVLLITDCSSRLDPVVSNEDGSVSYSPVDSSGINAKVLLYKGIDDAGRPLATNIFTIGEKSKVYALIKIVNRELHPGRDIMLHVDWIDPDGNSFFMKREQIQAADTLSEIHSVISIPAERRNTGEYKFRVYLFRELIAEKNFKLVNYNADSAAVFSVNFPYPLSAVITLGSIGVRDNSMPKDTGNVFEIKNKAKVYAGITLFNKEFYKGKEFKGEIAWCGEDGNSFYRRKFSISPFDTSAELSSAITANSKSREAGTYKLRVYLYNKLIGEKTFTLVPEQKEELRVVQVKGIDAVVVFCSKIGNKTKKAYGISDKFTINNKSHVHAVVSIADTREKRVKSAIRIEWISPGGGSFYNKTFKFGKKQIPTVLSNSISITRKRESGTYKCRVYYDKSLIAEKTFTLSPPS